MKSITLNLINRLLNQFNLEWYLDELVYYKDFTHDTLMVPITPNFDDVLTLLELPKDIDCNIEYTSHLIANSKYFRWNSFKKNKDEIRPFLDVLKDSNYKSSNYIKNDFDVVKWIKNKLNLDIQGQIDMIVPPDYDIKQIRNKFNGNLVRNWCHSDVNITEVINEFREYITLKNVDYFDYFLYGMSAKRIRQIFLQFWSAYNFNIKADNELPF